MEVKVKVYTIAVKPPRWVRNVIVYVALPVGVLVGAAVGVRAGVTLTTFASGTAIKADEVNANFANLNDAISNQASAISSLQGQARLEAFHIGCFGSVGTSAILSSSGTAPTIANGAATGTCTLIFPPSMWSSAPICTCSPSEGGNDADRKCQIGTASASALTLASWVGSTPQGMNLTVDCVGAR